MSTTQGPLRVIVHGGGWTTNIGNAFLQMGACALVKAAVPGASVTLASALPRWFFLNAFQRPRRSFRQRCVSYFSRRCNRIVGWPQQPRPYRPDPGHAFDLIENADYDLLVVAGMVLCQEYIDVIGQSVRAAAGAGVKVLFLGVGAEHYTPEEVAAFAAFLEEVRPVGFLSRDDRSYDLYGGLVQGSLKGIDCAFFAPDAFTPHPLRLPEYVAAAFDFQEEPPLETRGRPIIRAHHDCFGPAPVRYLGRDRTIISDVPQDYLTLYANASEVHSDRVHACVAALAYGRPVRFYGNTPRSSLFEPVGALGIASKLTQLDADLVSERKMAQVEWTRARITEAFPQVLEGEREQHA